MIPLETITLLGGYVLKVYQDVDAEAPYQDSALYLKCSSRHFQPSLPSAIESSKSGKWYAVPLYAYIHSGIALSLTPFSCPFDSGRIGSVMVHSSILSKDWTREQAAKSLVAEWNSYLSGERYGFVTEDPYGDQVDSCWGFDDRQAMIDEATSQASIALKRTQDEESKIERMMAL
jgi:hypothetical protein